MLSHNVFKLHEFNTFVTKCVVDFPLAHVLTHKTRSPLNSHRFIIKPNVHHTWFKQIMQSESILLHELGVYQGNIMGVMYEGGCMY